MVPVVPVAAALAGVAAVATMRVPLPMVKLASEIVTRVVRLEPVENM